MCCTRLAGNTGRKNRHFGTIAQFYRAISSELRHVSSIGKKLLNVNTSSTCSDNMVNFGLLTAEICWQVWGTPANFNGFRVLAALLHGQILQRWTEAATYIRQGGHHDGHWPTFLFITIIFVLLPSGVYRPEGEKQEAKTNTEVRVFVVKTDLLTNQSRIKAL